MFATRAVEVRFNWANSRPIWSRRRRSGRRFSRPPPSAVAARLAVWVPILWADFQRPFLRAVLAGYAIGSLAGFAVALLADRIPFLRRGLLPIGNLVSALPIIGIARRGHHERQSGIEFAMLLRHERPHHLARPGLDRLANAKLGLHGLLAKVKWGRRVVRIQSGFHQFCSVSRRRPGRAR